jgi:hypothetical protein
MYLTEPWTNLTFRGMLSLLGVYPTRFMVVDFCPTGLPPYQSLEIVES